MPPPLVEISQAAIGFLSLFGGFLKRIAPPEGVARVWTGLAALVAGAAILAVKLFAHLSAGSTSAYLWGGIAILLLAASLVLCFVYIASFQDRTIDYPGGRRIAGRAGEYSQDARQHLAAHPNLTRAQLLFEFAGNVESVWTPESLRRSRLALGLQYALLIGGLAFSLNLGLEVLSNRWKITPPPQARPTFSQRIAGLQDVHFEFDRSDLGQDASERLSANAAILRGVLEDFPKARLIVEGYCDDRASLRYNLALGYSRGEAVRAALVREGIDAARTQVVSHGNASRLCSEPSEECRRRNRRVRLTVVEQ